MSDFSQRIASRTNEDENSVGGLFGKYCFAPVITVYFGYKTTLKVKKPPLKIGGRLIQPI